ncbi:hypothetical protein CW751_11545 [Brumimicrobium salinarum]|uniref:Uncharacterized protein n=1 Tax=Brumimicrobium salinarum TaxID=2058658 RepID=A0A2I0R0M1_9FLAO|nr:hypothetical protein [Brumimicrobium salinarum]PKR80131.1 hypothetical protein CW751_11545 [Brumimicrobium salinarum]
MLNFIKKERRDLVEGLRTPQLLKSNVLSTTGMTAHKEVFGVKLAQAKLEQTLPPPSHRNPAIPK